MTDHLLHNLKYPIGCYSHNTIRQSDIVKWTNDIKELPSLVEKELSSIGQEAYAYTYRPEGWNIRQVVHHLADSHINALIRFKLALTEDNPTIKPYDEGKWAMLDDVNQSPISASISILNGLHDRMYRLIKGMNVYDHARTYVHSEHNKTFDIAYTIGMYSWHGRHHLAHIQQAIKYQRIGW